MNIEIKNNVDQLKLYEEFKKYCKYYGENILDNGVRRLNVQNGHDQDYSMNLNYIPVSSGLSSSTDSLVVKGRASGMYNSIDELLNIGYEMLGQDSFCTKEEVESMEYPDNGLSTKHR